MPAQYYNDSLYGQAVEEGGIADMFINDVRDKSYKKKRIANSLPIKLKRYCPYCGKMQPY